MKTGMYFKAGEENPLFDFQLKFNKHVEADDITYEDYLIYKQMEQHKKFLAPGYENTTWHTITSAIWAITGTLAGISLTPWLFCDYILAALFGGIATYGYVASAKDKEHINYHKLYKCFKKNKLWDRLKSYMHVYVCSDRFNKDKAEYEYKQADKKLQNYINDASFEINCLTIGVRDAKHAYEQNLPEQERTPDVKIENSENKIIVHKNDTSELENQMAVGGIIRKLMAKLTDKKVANVEIKFNEVDTTQPAPENEQISIDEINTNI